MRMMILYLWRVFFSSFNGVISRLPQYDFSGVQNNSTAMCSGNNLKHNSVVNSTLFSSTPFPGYLLVKLMYSLIKNKISIIKNNKS
jgi:hypothetical protein